MKRSFIRILALAVPATLLSLAAIAEDTSVSPYIDQLREKIQRRDEKEGKAPETNPEVPDPYIQSLKRKLPPSREENIGESPQPFIDRLKEKNPENFSKPLESESYSEREKAKLPEESLGGAIEAVNEGRSDLKMKRPGKIKAAFGFRVGTAMSHAITGNPPSTTSQPFENIYGTGFRPDFTLYGEYQPFHDETWGSLGLIGAVGLSYYGGTGVFSVTDLQRPDGSGIGPLSQTQFKFYAVPINIGADYRLNLGKYVRPFISVAPGVMGYMESRSDGLNGNRGHSMLFDVNVGALLMADWISRDATWNLYQDYGVKHIYFSVEYERLSTIASDIDFSFSGLLAGMSFEF